MLQDNILSTNDVLLGRGHFANKWKGNDFFRNIVHSFKRDYITSSNESKRQIAKTIVDIIYGLPGRFLKQDEETKRWIEVNEKDAIRKTRQALREGQPQLVKEINSIKRCFLHSVSNDLDNETITSSPALISETNTPEGSFGKGINSIQRIHEPNVIHKLISEPNASEDSFEKEINSILRDLEPNVQHTSKKRRLGYNNEDCNSEFDLKNSYDVQNNALYEQDPLIEFKNWMNSPIPDEYLQNNISQSV